MIPGSSLHTVAQRPVLVWRCDRPWLGISSSVHGGGIGLREWVFNATVIDDYDDPDPAKHIANLAGDLALSGTGTGLLTAVDVGHAVTAVDGGVHVTTTTGVGHPIWAAEELSEEQQAASLPGTINVVCWCPVRLAEGALVNAVATIAEAKAQALWESGVEGTGTVTDASVVLCPPSGDPESYGGPRSRVGACLARAVHASVRAGLRVESTRFVPG